MPNLDPTYVSVAETFGFVHHEGTDPALELEVLKCVLVREGLVSKLRDLVKRINAQSQISSVPNVYSRRVRGSSSFKKDFKRQVLIVLTECRKVTAKLTSCILKWRQSTKLPPPRPFIWRSENYLLRVRHDLNFLAECSVLVKALKIPKERMMDNPLMLPNNLNNAISPEFWFIESNISTIPVTDDDVNIKDEQKKKERMVLRKAEAVLLIEEKYEEIKNSGQQLGHHFLQQAIDIISPPKEPSIKLCESLETKYSNLKVNSDVHSKWQKSAKKQLAALEKGELSPHHSLIPKRSKLGCTSKDEKKRSRIPSIPKEVICFHGLISKDFDETTYSDRFLSGTSIFGEKSFLAQEELFKKRNISPSISSNEKITKKHDTSVATKRQFKNRKLKSQSQCSLDSSKQHIFGHTTVRTQAKSIHRSSLNNRCKKNCNGNLINPLTGDLITCFTPDDQSEIISINKPSSSEMWVAEIIHTLLCPGQYAPTNLSWERFQSRVREEEFIQTLNSFDPSNIKGPKMKALKCLFQNQAYTNGLPITQSVAKLAAWASKIISIVLPNHLELIGSLQNLNSFFHKDQIELNEKKDKSISDCHNGMPMKKASYNSANKIRSQKFSSQPLAVGKEKGKLLCSCQQIISDKNMFVSCFSTKKRFVSVKVYDASSSEEFRNIFKVPTSIKSIESMKQWIFKSLLNGLRLDSKSRRKLVLLPSAYEFKHDMIMETQNEETSISKNKYLKNDFIHSNVEVDNQKENVLVNEQNPQSNLTRGEKFQGQTKQSTPTNKLLVQNKGDADELSLPNITNEEREEKSSNKPCNKIISRDKRKTSCDECSVDYSSKSNDEISPKNPNHSGHFVIIGKKSEEGTASHGKNQNNEKINGLNEDVEDDDKYDYSDNDEENSFRHQNEANSTLNDVNEKNEVKSLDSNKTADVTKNRCGNNNENIDEPKEVDLKYIRQTLYIDDNKHDNEIKPHHDVICDQKEKHPQNKLTKVNVDIYSNEEGYQLNDSQMRISNKTETNYSQDCQRSASFDKIFNQNENKSYHDDGDSIEKCCKQDEEIEVIREEKSILLHGQPNETRSESLASEEEYSDDSYTDYSNFEDDVV